MMYIIRAGASRWVRLGSFFLGQGELADLVGRVIIRSFILRSGIMFVELCVPKVRWRLRCSIRKEGRQLRRKSSKHELMFCMNSIEGRRSLKKVRTGTGIYVRVTVNFGVLDMNFICHQ